MVSYWILVTLYVINFLVAVVGLVNVTNTSFPQKQPPSAPTAFTIFVALVCALLIYLAFSGAWTPVAILFTIIWASRWVGGTIKVAQGFVPTAGMYCMSMVVCLVQIILLLIYGWGM